MSRRRTGVVFAALALMALGSPLIAGCGAQTTIAEGESNQGAESDSADRRALKDEIAALTKLIETNPNDAIAYYNRGVVKGEGLGDNQGAIADYSKAIEINPQDPDAYSNRGNAKSHLRDYQGAIADYNKAIEINPKHDTALGNRGIVKYVQQGMQGVCVDCCSDWKKALSLDNEKTVGMFSDPRLDLDWCLNMR